MSLPRPDGSDGIIIDSDVRKDRPGVFARVPSRRSAGAEGAYRARKIEKR